MWVNWSNLDIIVFIISIFTITGLAMKRIKYFLLVHEGVHIIGLTRKLRMSIQIGGFMLTMLFAGFPINW
jgi:hypothetical protein